MIAQAACEVGRIVSASLYVLLFLFFGATGLNQAYAQTVTTYTNRVTYNAAIPSNSVSTLEDFSSVISNFVMSTVADNFRGFAVTRTGTGSFGSSGFCPALSDPFLSVPVPCMDYNINAPNLPGILGSYGPSANVVFTPTNEAYAFGFDTIDWNDGSERSDLMLELSNGTNIPISGPINAASNSPASFFGFVLDAASVAAGIHIDRIVWSGFGTESELVGYWDIVTSLPQPAEISVVPDTTTTNLGQNTLIMDADDTVSFTFDFTNNGSNDIGPVTFTSALTGILIDCPPSGTNVVGNVPVGSTVSCTVTYTLVQIDFDNNGGGDLDIDELVSADFDVSGTPVTITDAAQSPIIVIPSLLVSKVADKLLEVPVGDTITYTYEVTNDGNQTVSNVQLSDSHNAAGPIPAPANETLKSGSSASSTDSSINNGIWDTLSPGDAVLFTGTYLVLQDDIDTLQ